MSKPPITVLLVEDHAIVREGIRKLLELNDDFDVVGEAKDGRQAVALVQKLRPAVVVMDVAMALLNGLEATRQILAKVPDTRVIILTSYNDDAYLKAATESGAMGFLLKQVSFRDLSRGIREVGKGKVFFGPFLSKRVAECQRKLLDRPGLPKPRPAGLTAREMEVLQLVAEGNAGKQIAVELRISAKTVEKHRERLMLKLGIPTAAGVTRYAIREGIIENSVQLTIV